MPVSNITSVGIYSCPFNLSTLSHQLPNANYNPKKFNGLKLRKIDSPSATALLFSSGKFVLTGIKSLEEVSKTSLKIEKLLAQAGIMGNVTSIKTVNIVYSGRLSSGLWMDKLCRENKDASLEYEIFPGCIMKVPGTKARATFFHNGKYFITGQKTLGECLENELLLLDILNNYIKP